jgi:hypothetical protein
MKRRVTILDCGGKRSATPLWGADWKIEGATLSESAVALRSAGAVQNVKIPVNRKS